MNRDIFFFNNGDMIFKHISDISICITSVSHTLIYLWCLTGRESDCETRHFVTICPHITVCPQNDNKAQLDLTYTLYHLKAWSQLMLLFFWKEIIEINTLFSNNALN